MIMNSGLINPGCNTFSRAKITMPSPTMYIVPEFPYTSGCIQIMLQVLTNHVANVVGAG